jgi:hypothetical protein
VTTGKIAAALDEAIYPCPQVDRLRLELVHAACKLNAVYAVIADTVAAYREFVLLRFALSLTASLSY